MEYRRNKYGGLFRIDDDKYKKMNIKEEHITCLIIKAE
jgi:hypothetical protein